MGRWTGGWVEEGRRAGKGAELNVGRERVMGYGTADLSSSMTFPVADTIFLP